jgi:kynurenine formamidase
MDSFKMYDLTHALAGGMPTWTGDCGFVHSLVGDLGSSSDASGPQIFVHRIAMDAGIGTHMDAPAHFFRGGKSIVDLKLEELITFSVVINVSDQMGENFILGVEHIRNWERRFNEIASNSLIIICTGWGKYFGLGDRYRNNLQFPSIGEDAADYLLSKNPNGIGIDTLSPDLPDTEYPVHRLFLGAGKYILENVANAHLLPAVGAYIIALPLKIADGTEAPVRLIGLVDKSK